MSAKRKAQLLDLVALLQKSAEALTKQQSKDLKRSAAISRKLFASVRNRDESAIWKAMHERNLRYNRIDRLFLAAKSIQEVLKDLEEETNAI